MSNSCDLMDYSPPASSVHRISQASILEWVSIPFSRGSSQPRDRTQLSCLTDSLLAESPRKVTSMVSFNSNSVLQYLFFSDCVSAKCILVSVKESESEVARSCPPLCDPMDCSPRGSSIHGIFPARVLEWVAISFTRGSSPFRDQRVFSRVFCISSRYFYHLSHERSSL